MITLNLSHYSSFFISSERYPSQILNMPMATPWTFSKKVKNKIEQLLYVLCSIIPLK